MGEFLDRVASSRFAPLTDLQSRVLTVVVMDRVVYRVALYDLFNRQGVSFEAIDHAVESLVGWDLIQHWGGRKAPDWLKELLEGPMRLPVEGDPSVIQERLGNPYLLFTPGWNLCSVCHVSRDGEGIIKLKDNW